MTKRLVASFWLTISLTLFASGAQATPLETSCDLLGAIGSNNVAAIEPVMSEATESWLPDSRASAIQSLTKLATDVSFNGGTVFQVTDLGDDLVEHLVILRLSKGDVHGMVLRYTWSSDGLVLTGMDYKQKVEDLSLIALSVPAKRLVCGG